MTDEVNETLNSNRDHYMAAANLLNKNNPDFKNGKRTKERRIGYIIEKVSEWRNMYNGNKEDNGAYNR